MMRTYRRMAGVALVSAAALLFLLAPGAEAVIDGITGTTFNLWARADHISTPDGGSPLIWGYANGASSRAQYPGPTMIVNQGELITVNLINDLPADNVSIVFPGHQVSASGGSPGLLTREAPPDNTTMVTYTFTATHAGTYMYHSGTSPELQVEMGLVGAIIVRPTGYNPAAPTAYEHAGTDYDHEYLFLLSEMDPRIHNTVEFHGSAALAATDYLSNYNPNYWFINGRAGPDTLVAPFDPLLPTQPYNVLPRMVPGDKVLLRTIGGGRDQHPFHPHGNHTRVIARDGRVLTSAPDNTSVGVDLGVELFTLGSVPGGTIDSVFQWTGKGLGFDIYGTAAAGAEFVHNCIDVVDNETNLPATTGPYIPGDGFANAGSDRPYEWCADHGVEIPVTLPGLQDLAFGGFYSGSPYMGAEGTVPVGEGGLNPNAGFTFIWHSHAEREIVNFDIFPGGMLTFMFVEPPGTPIP